MDMDWKNVSVKLQNPCSNVQMGLEHFPVQVVIGAFGLNFHFPILPFISSTCCTGEISLSNWRILERYW